MLARVSAPAPPAAGPPWTPVLRGPWRHIGELERLRPAWGSSWEPAAARAGVSLPAAHSQEGAPSPLTHSPRRPPSPGLPWTAGEPQSGAGSSGAAGVGGAARSVTVSTATCGGRGRWGGTSVSPGTGQLAPWRRGWEARRPAEPSLDWRPGSQGPRTSSEVSVVHHIHCRKVITGYHSHPRWLLRLSPCLLGCAVFSCVYLHVSMYI